MIEIDKELLAKLLPERKDVSDKWSFGRVVIISGSKSYIGCSYFSSQASLYSGVGLVNILTNSSNFHDLRVKVNEVMVESLEEDEREGCIDNCEENFNKIKTYLEKASAVLIGPGLGISKKVKEIVLFVNSNSLCPLVLDADAISNLQGSVDVFKKKRDFPIVITPHRKEFERLFASSSEISDRELLDLSSLYNITIIKKGTCTKIAEPSGAIAVNGFLPNSALSKGGSGDILAGLVVSFLAQGLKSFEASLLATGLLSLSAEIARGKYTAYSASPTRILECLSEAFRQLIKKQ